MIAPLFAVLPRGGRARTYRNSPQRLASARVDTIYGYLESDSDPEFNAA